MKQPSAGYGLTMVRPHMRDLPDWSAPDGFSVHHLRSDDIGLWVDIVRDAEQYIDISYDRFYDSFGRDFGEIESRCFILLDSRGCGAATCSAWYRSAFFGEDYGQLHWLYVRPAFQQKGLGKALISLVLRELKRHHDKTLLITSSARISALKLYLKSGFLPFASDEKEAERWMDVGEILELPPIIQQKLK